jgi:hypothetical protein
MLLNLPTMSYFLDAKFSYLRIIKLQDNSKNYLADCMNV